MFRSKSLLTILIVCMLSIFFLQHMSYAHGDHKVIDKAEGILEKSEKDMNRTVGRWGAIMGDFETLINEWNTNQAAIKAGHQAALSGTAVAIVSGAAAAVAAVASSGALAPAVVPAFYSAYVALQGSVAPDSIDLSALLKAMDVVLALVDAALSDVSAAWSGGTVMVPRLNSDHEIVKDANNNTVFREKTLIGYKVQYRAYLTTCATHIGMDYDTLFQDVQTNSGKVDSHDFEEPLSYYHYSEEPVAKGTYDWETWDLPKDYECEGPCTDMFRSPHEAFSAHRTECGTGDNVDKEYESSSNREYVLGPGGLLVSVPILSKSELLKKRKVDQGCGRPYYTCDSGKVALHQVRDCKKTVYVYDSAFPERSLEYECTESYRRCMGHTFDHNNRAPGKSAHSDDANSGSGEEQEQAENPSPPSSPAMHACGVHESWQSGEHSAAGCGTSGHYACDSSNHAAAGCSTSGHYACDGSNHAAAGCGAAGHYACDGSDHSLQASCLSTDSNGNTCTVASFYACDGHTHVYPAPTVTCANGHSYDPTNTAENNNHRTRTCRWCSQTWQKCVSGAPQCLVKMNRKCWAIE